MIMRLILLTIMLVTISRKIENLHATKVLLVLQYQIQIIKPFSHQQIQNKKYLIHVNMRIMLQIYVVCVACLPTMKQMNCWMHMLLIHLHQKQLFHRLKILKANQHGKNYCIFHPIKKYVNGHLILLKQVGLRAMYLVVQMKKLQKLIKRLNLSQMHHHYQCLHHHISTMMFHQHQKAVCLILLVKNIMRKKMNMSKWMIQNWQHRSQSNDIINTRIIHQICILMLGKKKSKPRWLRVLVPYSSICGKYLKIVVVIKVAVAAVVVHKTYAASQLMIYRQKQTITIFHSRQSHCHVQNRHNRRNCHRIYIIIHNHYVKQHMLVVEKLVLLQQQLLFQEEGEINHEDQLCHRRQMLLENVIGHHQKVWICLVARQTCNKELKIEVHLIFNQNTLVVHPRQHRMCVQHLDFWHQQKRYQNIKLIVMVENHHTCNIDMENMNGVNHVHILLVMKVQIRYYIMQKMEKMIIQLLLKQMNHQWLHQNYYKHYKLHIDLCLARFKGKLMLQKRQLVIIVVLVLCVNWIPLQEVHKIYCVYVDNAVKMQVLDQIHHHFHINQQILVAQPAQYIAQVYKIGQRSVNVKRGRES
eukprot:g3713.t1